MFLRLPDRRQPEHNLREEPGDLPQAVTPGQLHILPGPLPVFRLQQAQVVFILDGHAHPERDKTAHLIDPVVRLIGIGADDHIHIRCQSVPVRLIGVLRNQNAVPHGKVVVHIDFFIDCLQLFFRKHQQVLHVCGTGRLHDPPGQALAFFLRVGQGNRSAFGNHPAEQSPGFGNERQQGNAAAARGFPEKRYLVRIPAESRNILPDPPQGLNLVPEPQVRRVRVFLPAGYGREVGEAHHPDPVGNGNQYDLRMGFRKMESVVQRVRRTAPSVAAAVNKDHDGLPGRRLFPGPYVQVQAVLALRIIGRALRGPFGLNRRFSVIFRFKHAVAVRCRQRLFPALVSRRRAGKRNPAEDFYAALPRSHKDPVPAFCRCRRIIWSGDQPVLSPAVPDLRFYIVCHVLLLSPEDAGKDLQQVLFLLQLLAQFADRDVFL